MSFLRTVIAFLASAGPPALASALVWYLYDLRPPTVALIYFVFLLLWVEAVRGLMNDD